MAEPPPPKPLSELVTDYIDAVESLMPKIVLTSKAADEAFETSQTAKHRLIAGLARDKKDDRA